MFFSASSKARRVRSRLASCMSGRSSEGCPSSPCSIAKRASFCCVELPHTPARHTLFPLCSSCRRMPRAYSADAFCSSKPCWIALDASSVGRPSTARCSTPSPHYAMSFRRWSVSGIRTPCCWRVSRTVPSPDPRPLASHRLSTQGLLGARHRRQGASLLPFLPPNLPDPSCAPCGVT
jgi:hypothetical protein